MPKKTYDDDLFKESTMSFGEHLAELQVCLFKAVLGLAVGFGIGLAVGNQVVQFIESPLKTALQNYFRDKAIAAIKQEHNGELPPNVDDLINNHGLMPEPVLVEPHAMVEAINQQFPGAIQSSGLPDFQFMGDDLLPEDAKNFVVALQKAAASGEPSTGAHLWKMLPAELRESLDKNASEKALSTEQRTDLIAAMNTWLQKRDFYQPADFPDVELSADVSKLFEDRSKLASNDVRRLNWLVLSRKFSEIRSPHRQLTSVILWREMKNDPRVTIKTLNAQEGFMIWIKASLITGIVIASPWIFFQIWSFVAAGLYPLEKHYVYVLLPFSIALFLSGSALAFFIVFKPVLKFLLGFNEWLGIDPDPRISEWLSFVLWLPLGFGLSFQLPLLMLFVERIGILSVRFLIEMADRGAGDLYSVDGAVPVAGPLQHAANGRAVDRAVFRRRAAVHACR